MPLRYRSYFMAAFAFVCVLLCTSTALRAEDDDDEDHPIVRLTAAEQAQVQAQNSQPVPTVALSTKAIVPAEVNGDVRNLPPVLVPRYLHSWNDFVEPMFVKAPPSTSTPSKPSEPPMLQAPMPAPLKTFAGLSFGTTVTGGQAGAGWPPDTNGDVGPVYFIQAVNDAWGIFDKKTGTRVAAFTEDQLWSSASTGTPCDSSNFGDPVVLYDSRADRWMLTNFAFGVDSGGNPIAPFYQCFAVSKSGDPVAGGWWLYAVQMDTGSVGAPPAHTLADYPKFGLWTDCLYMGANGFNNDTGDYAGAIFAAFDRNTLFAGQALSGMNSSIGFINSTSNFSVFPANLQGAAAGSQPPAGTAEYFVGESQSAYAFDVRKFQKGANSCGAGSSLSGATSVSQASYGYPATASGSPNIVPQPGVARKLDSLGDRLMQRVVYRRVGSAESLWVIHTTCGTGISSAGVCLTTLTPTQPQWAQINVTGGTIAATPVQQQIYNLGDGLYRWMGSVNVDHSGDMAIGYNTSSGTSPNFPSIAYAGRLVSDALGQLPQTEVQLAAGKASQDTCNPLCSSRSTPISRWGDYSAMVIDPADDCTFWYTNMYFSDASHSTGSQWDSFIGSFKFPGCTGTRRVTAAVSGGNGSVSPALQTIEAGSTASIAITPNSLYHVASVTGDTCTVTQQGSTTTWKTGNVSSACAITVTFAIDTFTVTAAVNGGNGNVTPATQNVTAGNTASITVTPATNYHVDTVNGDTCSLTQQGSSTTWTTDNITSDCAITATFALNPFNVTASVNGSHGTITPPTQPVNLGDTATFTVTPDAGFVVVSVKGDTCAVSNTSGTTWTSSAISADCAVSATFAATSLVFTVQPTDRLRGTALGMVEVTEQDSSNHVIDDNATVDFTIAACGGTFDLGSVQLVHGVGDLTSAQLFYTLSSGLQIDASTGTVNGSSRAFAVTANPDFEFADGFDGCRL